jgi:hypothetical protein
MFPIFTDAVEKRVSVIIQHVNLFGLLLDDL